MGLDVELARFVLIASVLVASIVYARWHLVTGGTLTPAYLLLLLFAGSWQDVVGVVVAVAVTLVILDGVVLRWIPLTKPWVYGTGVLVAACGHAAVTATGLGVFGPDGLPLLFTVGFYVTPGIIAYDIRQQGPRSTLTGIAAVMGGTFLVALPFLFVGVDRPDAPFLPAGNIPTNWWWLAIGVSVAASLALRMARNLPTGGYVAGAFLVQIFTWPLLALVAVIGYFTHVVTQAAHRMFGFTPRQRFQMAFLVGAISMWTVVFWLAALGWEPAVVINSYPLEPLVLIGLVGADMGRSSFPRTAVGTLTATGLVGAAVFAISLPVGAGLGVFALVTAAVTLIALPAMLTLRDAARRAEELGRAARPGSEPAQVPPPTPSRPDEASRSSIPA